MSVPSIKSFNVLIADDQPLFVEGVQSVLSHPSNSKFAYQVRGVAKTGAQVSEFLRQNPMDLLVMDLSLSEPDGLAILPGNCRRSVRKEGGAIDRYGTTLAIPFDYSKTTWPKGG